MWVDRTLQGDTAECSSPNPEGPITTIKSSLRIGQVCTVEGIDHYISHNEFFAQIGNLDKRLIPSD
jgi:hypothetical protein